MGVWVNEAIKSEKQKEKKQLEKSQVLHGETRTRAVWTVAELWGPDWERRGAGPVFRGWQLPRKSFLWNTRQPGRGRRAQRWMWEGACRRGRPRGAGSQTVIVLQHLPRPVTPPSPPPRRAAAHLATWRCTNPLRAAPRGPPSLYRPPPHPERGAPCRGRHWALARGAPL